MINTQYLQNVREQLMVATADLSGATKGQLVAFVENAMFEATPRSNKRMKVVDPGTGRMVRPSNPPVPGKQSRAKGSAIALVLPVEYSTASWRRALLSLEEHQKAWLLWNYSENNRCEHQEPITRWPCVSLYGWRRRMRKRSWQDATSISTRTLRLWWA